MLVLGRTIARRIHSEASRILKNKIIPILREDDVVRKVRFYRLLILYENKMNCKYRSEHHYDMIRANLRLLGRFLISISKINPLINEMKDLYDTQYYGNTIEAINEVSGFNQDNNTYRAPSTAYNLGSLIKKIGFINVCDCIKRKDDVSKKKHRTF